MQMMEACRAAGLTRKAALVAMEAGLLAPARTESGYRDFSPEDVQTLRRIAILRGLGLSTAEIRAALAGERETLQRAAMRQRLARDRAEKRGQILAALAEGNDWEKAEAALRVLRADESVTERLMEAFPGFFGRYMSLHFAAFFPERIETAAQEAALAQIIRWLDQVREPSLTPGAKALLDTVSEGCSPELMMQMHREVRAAAQEPEKWLQAHQASVQAWRESQPVENAALRELREGLRAMTQEQGYADVFLPAMERLSPDYAAYAQQLRAADAAFRVAEP